MNQIPNLCGKVFSRWTVLDRAPNNKDQDAMWRCICVCGTERAVRGITLRNGQSTSCGCYQRECARRLKVLPDGEGAFRQLLNTYRQLAKARGLLFELTRDEFKTLTLGNCFYCGIKPAQVVRRKFGTPYTYNGVDRLDSSKGYSIENCVSCCGVHNLMKLDMSVDAFLAACRSVVKHRPEVLAVAA